LNRNFKTEQLKLALMFGGTPMNPFFYSKGAGAKGLLPLSPAPQIPAEAPPLRSGNLRLFRRSLTKPNTLQHNQPASVALLRRLFALSGTLFGFPLESAFTFTGIPTRLGDGFK